ncbi:MAG: hypothetical protein FWD57_05350 [Polyangiaceae bacterium]|nr:hypothetical protein [Polyangiaceae bacterium]
MSHRLAVHRRFKSIARCVAFGAAASMLFLARAAAAEPGSGHGGWVDVDEADTAPADPALADAAAPEPAVRKSAMEKPAMSKPAMSKPAGTQSGEGAEAGATLLGSSYDVDSRFRSFTLTANPITLSVLKLGVNLEFLPARHHAIVVNPFIWGFPYLIGAIGGEIGYHFYSGDMGANGFFIGPSFGAATGCVMGDCASGIGFALDIGGQHITKTGLTIGGGLRFFHVVNEPDLVLLPFPLFMLGYSS